MDFKKAFNLGGNIISIGIAAAAFFFFFLILNISFILSALVSLAAYIGSILIFAAQPTDKDIQINLNNHGVTPEMVKQTIAEGQKKAKEILSYSTQVKNPSVKKKIQDIYAVCGKIFDDFEKDPKDIKAARQFLSYYLESTVNILKRYVDLAAHGELNPEIQASLKKVENLLDTIKTAFEKQLARLLEDDVMDLDAEIAVLEQTMKMDQ
jgi:5-bromo-4-chloroindolyl phosphate hydrolysis protein